MDGGQCAERLLCLVSLMTVRRSNELWWAPATDAACLLSDDDDDVDWLRSAIA